MLSELLRDLSKVFGTKLFMLNFPTFWYLTNYNKLKLGNKTFTIVSKISSTHE